MRLMTAIALRIGDILNAKGMTQLELAERSGISQNTITNVLNQNYNGMNTRVLYCICETLEITLHDFFNDPLFDEKHLEY